LGVPHSVPHTGLTTKDNCALQTKAIPHTDAGQASFSKVEGLVGGFPRVGSSPLRRMRESPAYAGLSSFWRWMPRSAAAPAWREAGERRAGLPPGRRARSASGWGSGWRGRELAVVPAEDANGCEVEADALGGLAFQDGALGGVGLAA